MCKDCGRREGGQRICIPRAAGQGQGDRGAPRAEGLQNKEHYGMISLLFMVRKHWTAGVQRFSSGSGSLTVREGKNSLKAL